jgi:hypothetical protein
MPPFMHSHAPGGLPPYLPFHNILDFFMHENDFEKVANISADQNNEAGKVLLETMGMPFVKGAQS